MTVPHAEHQDQGDQRRRYLRYVALGDSTTEGIGDGDEESGYRGVADRFADRLAATSPQLHYANLAVRGCGTDHVRTVQLPAALALRPDLATVVAGVNDFLRPRYDVDRVAGHLEATFAALTAAGTHVVTLTFPDIGKIAPLARPIASRARELNTRIRDAAARHGVTVVDTASHPVTVDPRLWSADRLHLSPLGHDRSAAAFAQALQLPDADDSWTLPLPVLPAPKPWQALRVELHWVATFLGPWVLRRLRGRSSGDGRTPKRPQLTPVAATPPQNRTAH
ncbi:SGNH/GDSL hydrolase family protein [Streptomyces sp. NBC_01795]|uniref:SGNH/GDSL hydrolase family protein n=1 Tax=unclassified Streptomyces TaxID=2593676 RepID=UPI002DD7A3FE|nr:MULTISPECIES: SGNH/GDSL hydrolase family protein [unclassified Streptomyces]WSA90689.1 SGNH/GDSL hydrolase family protein [Streptomyces sp. NBC_01795]WSB75014.1 SGNH/GDSL hydrolase family protein [Streptomyces sp. NBC_01775]WSS16707.1 SGNH/GDSL hydrolase family protein [Streptomyces sp. NBC_01186]